MTEHEITATALLMVTVMPTSAGQAAMPAGMVVYTSLSYLVLASLFVKHRCSH
jgi:hypothetical protein